MGRAMVLTLVLAGIAGGAAGQTPPATACAQNPFDWARPPCTADVAQARRIQLEVIAVLAPACLNRRGDWPIAVRGYAAQLRGPDERFSRSASERERAATERELARTRLALAADRRAACAEMDRGTLAEADRIARDYRESARNCRDWSCVQPVR